MNLHMIPERAMCRRASRPKQATPWEQCCSGCCSSYHTPTRQQQPLRAMDSPRHPCQKQVSSSSELSLATLACTVLYFLRRQHLPLKPCITECGWMVLGSAALSTHGRSWIPQMPAWQLMNQ